MSLNHSKSTKSHRLIDTQLSIDRFNGSPENRSIQLEAALKDVEEVIHDLHDMLKRYGPLWYTLSHDERLQSVLRILSNREM